MKKIMALLIVSGILIAIIPVLLSSFIVTPFLLWLLIKGINFVFGTLYVLSYFKLVILGAIIEVVRNIVRGVLSIKVKK